jgi:hypothetical protein
MCIIHEDIWHEGETCEEYDYRSSGRRAQEQRSQEAASLAAISKSAKKCPGLNCAYYIEKNNGCDHMTCKSGEQPNERSTDGVTGSRCRHEFCWACLCDCKFKWPDVQLILLLED